MFTLQNGCVTITCCGFLLTLKYKKTNGELSSDYFLLFQNCLLQLIPSAYSQRFLELSLGQQQYLGPTELTQYFVRESSMRKAADNVTVEVEVIIASQSGSETYFTLRLF